MITRGQNFIPVDLNIVGSSTFGRYPKISVEKTYNMFVSDEFLVDYAGYKIAVPASSLGGGTEGRGIFFSTKFQKLVVVIGQGVYFVTLTYNQQTRQIQFSTVNFLGNLLGVSGVVYITENNKPQIAITDGLEIYIYDPTVATSLQIVPAAQYGGVTFKPGYITFHDTYFICAALSDSNGNTNTWRLSGQNEGLITQTNGQPAWPSVGQNVGLLQTKPDNIQAVVRFPSKGNMIFVMGQNVTEAWFDTGAQIFPYQRANQYNIDYGCLSPATVAYMDQLVVWLGGNEKSGPIILASDGGEPRKISTDGIDYVFAQLQNPQDSQAFLYRQDGHVFYHINFYSDNLSLFYDFNTDKFYHACDQNANYFIAAQVAYYNNQYYFVSKNTGNIYAFDTIFTTYQDSFANGTMFEREIPRVRVCKNIRRKSQEYFVANDVGFTIETGETNYFYQNINNVQTPTVPRVDLSISRDGGATFGSFTPYNLNPIGLRSNRLMW
ncbi:MAG TPA: hypothetical protein VNW51_08940, partial [Mucilaginibacter sp.]|nr:hypothetical protein [Mucilaginibacter sp.]